MILGINKGHPMYCGASSSYGDETVKDREVGNRLIAMFREKGHTVIDCTSENKNNELYEICQKANRQYLDLFISIHLNSWSSSVANGVETYSLEKTGKGREYAISIQNELVKSIDWANRGYKTNGFYVLRKTVAPAVLVECGFVSNKKDMENWDIEKICRAIYKGVVGKAYIEESSENTNRYIITNYLPCGWKGTGDEAEGLDLEYILSYFNGVRCYVKSNSNGYWIETQYLDEKNINQLKQLLGSWIHSINY